MRVLLVSNYFPPERGSASRLVRDIAQFLHNAGDEVQVLTPPPSYLPSQSPQPPVQGVNVIEAGIPLPKHLPHLWSRGMEHLVGPWLTLLASRKIQKPDVVYAFVQPLSTGFVARMLASWFGVPLVIHLQDLFPHNVKDTGLLPHQALFAPLETLAKVLYRSAQGILVHAPGVARYLDDQRIPGVLHLPNWVDTNLVTPDPFCDNTPPRVLCAGNLGLAQGAEQFLNLATRFQSDPISFEIYGEGACLEALLEHAKREGLANVRFFPMLPEAEYAQKLKKAELFVVTLDSRIRYPVIPSRIADAMASSVPILGMLPDSDARAEIEKSGGGAVVDCDDIDGAAKLLQKLLDDSKLRRKMGQAGRRYAEENLDREKNLQVLRRILSDTR